jgi:hypothetical protein
MKREHIIEVISDMVGYIEPYGDTRVDETRYENQEKIIDIINNGLEDLIKNSKFKGSIEYSVDKIGSRAYDALRQIRKIIDEALEDFKPIPVDENELTNNEKVYFSVKPIMKRTTKEEFMKYLKNYPRRLERDVFGACEPPSVTYNDFELADKYPYSVVANTFLYDDTPGGYYYKPEEDRSYYVMVNYEEVFNGRTGNIEQ